MFITVISGFCIQAIVVINGIAPDSPGGFLAGSIAALTASSVAQFYNINVIGLGVGVTSGSTAFGILQVSLFTTLRYVSFLYIPTCSSLLVPLLSPSLMKSAFDPDNNFELVVSVPNRHAAPGRKSWQSVQEWARNPFFMET